VQDLEPAAIYQWIFPLCFGLTARFPSYQPIEGFSKALAIDQHAGERVAQRHADVLDDTNPIPLKLVQFTYQVPEGWSVVREARDDTIYRLFMRPKGWFNNPLGRWAQLELVVVQHARGTITDPDELKANTLENLYS
jgi:hypothetical protein